MIDSFSYNVIPVSACNLKKNKSKFPMSSKMFLMLSATSEKSNIIYDLYSFFAKVSAIVDFPTRLAPSSKAAYSFA